jgi:hypothetical protein
MRVGANPAILLLLLVALVGCTNPTEPEAGPAASPSTRAATSGCGPAVKQARAEVGAAQKVSLDAWADYERERDAMRPDDLAARPGIDYEATSQRFEALSDLRLSRAMGTCGQTAEPPPPCTAALDLATTERETALRLAADAWDEAEKDRKASADRLVAEQDRRMAAELDPLVAECQTT